MICPQCGRNNNEGNDFCNACEALLIGELQEGEIRKNEDVHKEENPFTAEELKFEGKKVECSLFQIIIFLSYVFLGVFFVGFGIKIISISYEFSGYLLGSFFILFFVILLLSNFYLIVYDTDQMLVCQYMIIWRRIKFKELNGINETEKMSYYKGREWKRYIWYASMKNGKIYRIYATQKHNALKFLQYLIWTNKDS